MREEYRLHKSDKSKGEAGRYQIIRTIYESENLIWDESVGVYFNKNTALNDLSKFQEK